MLLLYCKDECICLSRLSRVVWLQTLLKLNLKQLQRGEPLANLSQPQSLGLNIPTAKTSKVCWLL